MRFCFNLLHYKHRDFLRADDLDYVSGPLGISGGKMILSVSNHKGGVGKTTVSTLLAAYTARHTDKKILLIDADHNRGSSSIFFSNREPEYSIFDAFQCYAEDPYDTVSVSGATNSKLSTGFGSFLRNIFPFGVLGSSSNCMNTVGTM